MKRELIIGKYTLESLTNGMYASPLDMYREYVQNAVDSLDEAFANGIELPDKLSIDITIDAENRVITIRDNGVGVPAETAYADRCGPPFRTAAVAQGRAVPGIRRF